MQSIKENLGGKVTWGIDWLDTKTRGLSPGQVGMLLARAGVGKTALIINTLAANSAQQIPALFVSLEQLGAEVFERMAQNATEMTGEAIEFGFGTGDLEFMGSVRDRVGGRFSRVLVCDKSALTLPQLKAYIEAASTKLGERVRLLCVDYFGLLKQDGHDAYQRATEIAKGLKEVAKDCRVAVICIVQLNRTGGKGAIEVEMNMARDAGTIEEAADVMVGMWKAVSDEEGASHGVAVEGPNHSWTTVEPGPGYYPVYIKLLKNRKGAGDERTAMMFRASVMRFESIDWRPKKKEAKDSDFG
jgi:replicative DNA helicase